MADKGLQKLKRRELLQMLLIQCEETERLQKESDELRTEFDTMAESYERLKVKLNVKDARLNKKDAEIAALKAQIEDMKASRVIELADAGSIAEASLKLNGVFEAAQKAAEQYLQNVKRLSEEAEAEKAEREDNRIPFAPAWRAGIRKKTAAVPRTRQTLMAASGDGRG